MSFDRPSLVRWFPTLLVGCMTPPGGDPPGADDASVDASAEFRTFAERLGARTERHVIAWGEAPLADDGQRHRFAVLEPDRLGRGRGAYLIEAGPGLHWLISFNVDGRTMMWGGGGTGTLADDEAWRRLDDRAIEHGQSHPHGGEEITIALRGRKPVVLAHDYLGEVDTEVVERQRFAVDGRCATPCPPLRGFRTEDFALRVVGPARTVKALLAADAD
jgi:hypothetical protein